MQTPIMNKTAYFGASLLVAVVILGCGKADHKTFSSRPATSLKDGSTGGGASAGGGGADPHSGQNPAGHNHTSRVQQPDPETTPKPNLPWRPHSQQPRPSPKSAAAPKSSAPKSAAPKSNAPSGSDSPAPATAEHSAGEHARDSLGAPSGEFAPSGNALDRIGLAPSGSAFAPPARNTFRSTMPKSAKPESALRSDSGQAALPEATSGSDIGVIAKAGAPDSTPPDSTPRGAMPPAAADPRPSPGGGAASDGGTGSGAPSGGSAPPTETGPDAAAPIPATNPQTDKPYRTVTVFYGTDRKPVGKAANRVVVAVRQFRWAGVAAGITLLSFLIVARFCKAPWPRRVLVACGGITVLVLGWSLVTCVREWRKTELAGSSYGNERGTLQVGTCDVSIPPNHQVGELEGPTILRAQIYEDPLKHVVLLNTVPREPSEFHTQLKQRVAASPRRDLFVFIHGYNVSFEQAARRTAQMAHDLRFEGAPVFFSWPSQAGLFQYTVDENNVDWTVTNLKEFLLEVARNSGAKSVSLVAHSMGNRALTDALRAIAWELRGETLFQEVVLTAPDIDAEIFKRDIAPAIVTTARRVTLYASSDDEALAASKKIHGWPRAGDSGAELVVVPGVETVDVSGVDTSLLGHSYYGENTAVLADLFDLICEGRSAEQRRPRLERRTLNGLAYWALRRQTAKRDNVTR